MPYMMDPLPPSPHPYSKDGLSPFASLGDLPKRKHSRSSTVFYVPLDIDQQPPPPRRLQPQPLARRSASASPAQSPSPSSSSSSSPPSPYTSQLVILPNGKPLKPSLKSAHTSPILPQRLHARTQSLPPAPSKSVQFRAPDAGLESVRTYKVSGRPAALLAAPAASDTETETESDAARAFPFAFARAPPFLEIDPAPRRTSPVPPRPLPALTYASNPPPGPGDPHVLLESLALPRARPPVLRGTVLVRNCAFEKRVAARFTLDAWDTVSEVAAAYAGPALPAALTVGDLIARADAPHAWDRFTFSVRLPADEARLPARTLLLALRFSAPGQGEWWDNNGGENYRVGFRWAGGQPARRA
ncbi:carbohydrate-binding module family 21 protein [Auriscalpium vulgare]|uniref:Carbohydrate-binding module family 21 protein n=1 Tax=Auriscalpium vulgare TaxID=40419 RepID=A0ACB8S319_9AGAM|nr:carbohydrate-binding module family 21 protein [Auriscalpium vulgare]